MNGDKVAHVDTFLIVVSFVSFFYTQSSLYREVFIINVGDTEKLGQA